LEILLSEANYLHLFAVSKKKAMKKLSIYLPLILLLIMQSCDDDYESPSADLEINIEYYYGNGGSFFNGSFHTIEYEEAGGKEVDTLRIDKIKYYVSNFELVGNDLSGKEINYKAPEDANYFLLEYTNPGVESTFLLKNLPEGDYHTMTFYVGVDSLKSTAGIDERTGVLDVIENAEMYWTWNSGYIFFKLEGTSPQAPEVNGKNPITYHIGGFGGYETQTNNNLRKITLNFGQNSEIRSTSSIDSDVFLDLDVKKIFNSAHILRPAEYNTITMPTEASTKVADNIQEAFRYNHVHNYE
jgi:hypothetical protein